jgi:hypothetical protein
MNNKIAVVLVGLALAGCIGPRGGHYVGGAAADAIFPPSASDVDQVCRDHMQLEFNPVYGSPLSGLHGTALDEAQGGYYQKCMADLGHPGAVLNPAPPSQ